MKKPREWYRLVMSGGYWIRDMGSGMKEYSSCYGTARPHLVMTMLQNSIKRGFRQYKSGAYDGHAAASGSKRHGQKSRARASDRAHTNEINNKM